MSEGMKKRLSIGCALASNPGILLLDEPSAALDLVCKAAILDYFRMFRDRGGILVIATHDPQELELCTGYRLLRDGGTLVGTGWDVMSEYKAQYPDKIRMDLSAPRLRVYPDEVGKTAESGISHGKVAQKPGVPAAKQTKNEKSNKKVVDNAATSAYSDVNKDLPALTEEERAIVDAIRSGAGLVDDVIARVNLPAAKVSSALTMLVIKGVVEKLPGNRVSLK
jgi:ABC-type multidrug transport system ATPase subunit